MDFTAYTTDNWQDQLELIATKEGFNFTQDEDGDITLQKFSPYGQDFTIELVKPLDYRDALDELNTQLASYDVNEQAMVWYGANRGEPRDLQDLLEDMKWCKNKLQSLTDAVDYHYGFTPADYFNEAVMKEALSRTFEETGLADRSFSADMQEVLLDHMSRYDNPVTGVEEISTHGCASGVLSDFVYYSDTKEFYTKHLDDIEDFIYDLEDDLGESIRLDHPRYNSAVWLVTEESARLASDSLEENIQNTLEAWSEDLTKEQVEAFLQGNSNELISEHLDETLYYLEEDLEEEQNASLDANSEEQDASYYYISPRGFSNEYTVLKADNTDASKEVIDRLLYEDATNPDFVASLLSKDSPYCKECSEILKEGELYYVGLSAKDLVPAHPFEVPYYLPTKSSMAFEERPLQSDAPSIVVPSSPVQEQAQAILDARGGDVKSTQKQEEESQVNKSSLKL
ncbi:hypothetical protein [Porphyromonas sp.]|uniref:DUF7222 domain-containing protein n=1 Tax=Porphyromonas sp. TaxID=1924944 RepID=UPI003A945CAA